MAMTGNDGVFTISDVPAKSGYTIMIMKGSYTASWSQVSVTVSGSQTTALTPNPRNISSSELDGSGESGGGLVWQGMLSAEPANPEINWAYYNTEDKTSYIYNGASWDVLAARGDKGETGETGAPGKDGDTPYIGSNGNWFIDNKDTLIASRGEKGEKGETGNAGTIDGLISIGPNGNWFINGNDTTVEARGPQGAAGTNGTNGFIPSIGSNGNWWIDGSDTGYPSRGISGEAGTEGTDGYTPYIGLNGNWFINGEDQAVMARGPQGAAGTDGQDGTDGEVPEKKDGYWWIGETNTGIQALEPQTTLDYEDFGAGAVVEDTFAVTSPAEWTEAVTAIKTGGSGKNYVINVSADFSVNGGTGYTFEWAEDIKVSVRGEAVTISLPASGTGSLFKLTVGQNVILRGITLNGSAVNDSSLVSLYGGSLVMCADPR
jgi:hypothetical protein